MGSLDYKRIPWGQVSIKPVATYKFAAPKTEKDIAAGRNNAQDMSQMPAGSTMPGVGYVANQRRGLHQ